RRQARVRRPRDRWPQDEGPSRFRGAALREERRGHRPRAHLRGRALELTADGAGSQASVPRVVGVDPGTQSFDLCGLAEGEVFLEASIDADEARRAPAALVDRLEAAGPLDLIAAPSGYGLPLVPVAAL